MYSQVQYNLIVSFLKEIDSNDFILIAECNHLSL